MSATPHPGLPFYPFVYRAVPPCRVRCGECGRIVAAAKEDEGGEGLFVAWPHKPAPGFRRAAMGSPRIEYWFCRGSGWEALPTWWDEMEADDPLDEGGGR